MDFLLYLSAIMYYHGNAWVMRVKMRSLGVGTADFAGVLGVYVGSHGVYRHASCENQNKAASECPDFTDLRN